MRIIIVMFILSLGLLASQERRPTYDTSAPFAITGCTNGGLAPCTGGVATTTPNVNVSGCLAGRSSCADAVMSPSANLEQFFVAAPNALPNEFRVEELTSAEQARLAKAVESLRSAQAAYDAIERVLRRAHGESVRDTSTGWITTECRSAQVTVEIKGRYALVTTEYAGDRRCF